MLTAFEFAYFLHTFVVEKTNAMISRSTFRNISIMVVTSLLALTALQGAWVWTLYRDTVEDFERRAQSATYKTIYKVFRMDPTLGFMPSEQIRIDLDEFALYFTPNLLELDALQPYAVEIIERISQERVMMRLGERELIDNPTTFEIDIDDDGMFALRLHISVPYDKFLQETWGLILSSALMLLLMAGVLIYLLRTMFEQKNLELMRQDLTHNITHELKTPISVAVAANDALRNFSADSDPKRRRRYLDITALQLGQLSKMVEHILAASLENGDRKQLTIERFSLGALLEELQQGAELRSEKQVSLRVEIKEDMYIRADRFHLSNILSTIIDNSIKYSAESVNITLRGYISGKACIIEIEDDGLGMEQKHLKHIFEKFYRIPKGNVQEVRGFGLGLYYSKLIVERHGGTINATSRKGEGTTIKITLPEDEREEN